MKEITIKVCGQAATGKSILQYLLLDSLRKHGYNVEYVPDIDFPTEQDLVDYVNTLPINNIFANVNIKVESVQTKK